jgi:hypothetical protein
METLDQNNIQNSNQISERTIRNFHQASVWIIIASAVGLFTGLYFLYAATKLMSYSYASSQASVIMIMSLVFITMHIIGLTYGINMSKLKIYTSEEFDRASSKHMTYWVFCGIVYIIWFLLMLMNLSGGRMPF